MSLEIQKIFSLHLGVACFTVKEHSYIFYIFNHLEVQECQLEGQYLKHHNMKVIKSAFYTLKSMCFRAHLMGNWLHGFIHVTQKIHFYASCCSKTIEGYPCNFWNWLCISYCLVVKIFSFWNDSYWQWSDICQC